MLSHLAHNKVLGSHFQNLCSNTIWSLREFTFEGILDINFMYILEVFENNAGGVEPRKGDFGNTLRVV